MFNFFKIYLGIKQPLQKPDPGKPTNDPELAPEGYKDPAPVPLIEVIPRDNQQLIRGNQKKFSEHISYNINLLSQRLPDDSLVCKSFTAGTLSKTKITMIYLKNRANPGLVADIKDKLKNIKAEIILDSSYVERNLENSNISPFPQLETTQRPDVAESALTQGRVAVIVDGSPEVLLAPATFFDLMDTPDDAYQRWYVAANFFRAARYIMFLFAVALPAFYIALTSYNPELIPTRLLFIILATREGVPFPVYFEAFLMMGVAEAVRMMMIRVPSQFGPAIALFSGLALVGAGLTADIIGAPIVIIVTLTIISSFGIPNYDLRTAVRLIQFFTMIMASVLGMFGFAAAFFFIAVHMVTLRPFGIPYMAPVAPLEGSGWGHSVFRDNTVVMPVDETYKPIVKKPKDD